jgi:hypothetical protein
MSEKKIPKYLRLLVFQRAFGCCEYCMSSGQHTSSEFQMEHIIPLAKNGKSTFDNLALACQGCNGHKLIKTMGFDPETNQRIPLYNPRTDNWKEHFKWSEDKLQIIGLTPIGRGTVLSLNLNREKILNLRLVLKNSGLHPPLHSL